jgi:hypothetical protein
LTPLSRVSTRPAHADSLADLVVAYATVAEAAGALADALEAAGE